MKAIKKILLVDSDEHFLSSMQTVLESQGHSVTIATNAKEAYKEIKESFYNLVVSNVSVPYASGYELLVSLKKACKNIMKRIPLLVVSDMKTEGIIADCREIGVDDYMTKPLYVPDFMGRINRHLGEV